ncbi:MFS transporter [Limnobacter sp. 130]|uniref:MFS transporter n=1 Tax=Limnobacter sp. 130 TaxID=2653147 RepID=UPI001359C429|nr:MFS transporter [Limnobacter sp. 130]
MSPNHLSPPPLRMSFIIWGLAAAFYLFGFFQRVTPGVLTEELSSTFDLSRAALGNLSAFYFYFYAAMQIPVGLLVDRIGPRKILTVGCILGGLGALMFGFAPTLGWAAVGRGLVGGAVAVAWVSMLMLVAQWFSPSRFASMSGVSLAVGTMGAVLAGVPLRALSDLFGWRVVMGASGLIAALLGVLIWIYVRDMPSYRGYKNHVAKRPENEVTLPLLTALGHTLRFPAVWLIFWIPSGVCGAILTFTGLWGVPYLTTWHGLSVKEASLIITGMLIAFAAGSLFFGAFSDKLKQRKLPYFLGAVLSIGGFIILGLKPDLPIAVVSALLWATAFGGGSMVLSFGYVKESVPHHLGATAVGIVNLGVMVGPLVQQPVLGAILDHYAATENITGAYSKAGMTVCILVLAAWVATSIVSLMLSKETHAKPRFA